MLSSRHSVPPWRSIVIDFQAREEIFIKASAEAFFSIISDLTRHKELAGSG